MFPQTRWSVILGARDNDPEALALFCRAYWYPLYSFARRSGMAPADAEDATQSFFEHLLTQDLLARARRERGKLRSFLLRSFGNFTREEWRKRGAQKRGSGKSPVEIDSLSAQERFALEPRDAATPELEFERAWARELLRRALDRLGDDYEAAGRGAIYRALKDQLVDGSSELSYLEIARALGLSEASIRFAAFKLRQRYREVLKEIVAETVPTEEEVAGELVHLRTLFRS